MASRMAESKALMFRSLASLVWLLLTCFTLIAVMTSAHGQSNGMPLGAVLVKTEKGQFIFNVERAETVSARALGLMHRGYMADNHGMLFTWPQTRHITMWMANTVLSLDIVFIKKDQTVLRVESNTVPFSHERIPSGGPAKQVLELNAGAAKRIGLKPGDFVFLQ